MLTVEEIHLEKACFLLAWICCGLFQQTCTPGFPKCPDMYGFQHGAVDIVDNSMRTRNSCNPKAFAFTKSHFQLQLEAHRMRFHSQLLSVNKTTSSHTLWVLRFAAGASDKLQAEMLQVGHTAFSRIVAVNGASGSAKCATYDIDVYLQLWWWWWWWWWW